MNDDREILTKEIRLLDELISKKNELVKFAVSSGYSDILKVFNEEKLAAIQDYLKDNTPLNQAYSRLWNFLCNSLELFKNPTELENLLYKKDELMEQLNKLNEFERDYEVTRQRGESL